MILKKNSFIEVWGQHTIYDTFGLPVWVLFSRDATIMIILVCSLETFVKASYRKYLWILCLYAKEDLWTTETLTRYKTLFADARLYFTTCYCHSNVKTTKSASVAVLPSLHREVWLEVVFPISRLFVQDGRMHLLMPIKPPFLHSRSSWQLRIQLCLRLKTLKRISGTKPKQAINLEPL